MILDFLIILPEYFLILTRNNSSSPLTWSTELSSGRHPEKVVPAGNNKVMHPAGGAEDFLVHLHFLVLVKAEYPAQF